MKFLADEILADCSQNCQSTKINSPPKFSAIRYLQCNIYMYTYVSRFEKTAHFMVKINFKIGVLIQSTVSALSVALCCALIAPSVSEIRLLKVHKYAQCDCEKTPSTVLLPLLQTFYLYNRSKMADWSLSFVQSCYSL